MLHSQPLSEINILSEQDFIQFFGGIYEHTPTLAAAAYQKRPFADITSLYSAFVQALRNASAETQNHLLQAHPELAGRAAFAGTLTRESTQEQSQAGLTQLAHEETTQFDELNQSYRRKFGFPFILCVRDHKREDILPIFRQRLHHSREQERQTALEQVERIAYHRLQQLILS